MIMYPPGDWWKALRRFHTSEVIRLLLKRVLLVGVYGVAIAVASINFHTVTLTIGREYLSVLGILLSLLLVFRTNTAYDRYYEGRKVWGTLVSQCRGLAMEINALLPREARASRRYFAALISNFPIALEGSLRNNIRFDKMEATPDVMDRLKTAENTATTIIAVLMESMEQLRKVEIFDPTHLINIKQHYLAMMSVNGTCERIKATPIPYSYSFFIKCYITIFVLIMPLVLVESSGYWMVPFTMIGAYAMLGLEMIGNEIENPFGYDSNDLPITLLSNKIRVSVHDLLGVELTEEKKEWATRPYAVVH